MKTRCFLAVVAALSVGSSFIAACDCGSTSDSKANGGSPDAAANPNVPVTPGADASDGSVVCDKHLLAGFSQALTSSVDPLFGQYATMVLDENDDPLVAYAAVKASVDGNVAPGTCSPQGGNVTGCQGVYFTRWDPCVGAFTPPVVIESNLNTYNATGVPQVALAYDPTTKEIGVGYQKTLPTDPNWSDAFQAIYLGTRKAGQTAFTVQQVSDNVRSGPTDVSTATVPALAMGNGKIYMAFTTGTGAPSPCPANHMCLRFLSSTSASNPDAGNPDGGAVPHSFSYALVPNSAGFGGFAIPRELSIAVAIDGMGRPAVAYLEAPELGYNTVLNYWRSDMTDSVKVTDTNNVQNDDVTVNLAFVGTKPRVAGLLTNDGATHGITYASSPNEGTTWNAAVPILTSGGAGFYTSLAASSTAEAITSHHNNSPSADSVAAGCTTNPIVARSTNGGTSFSGCSLPRDVDMNGTLSSAYGTSRLAGKLVVVGNAKDTVADGGPGHGIVYFQDP